MFFILSITGTLRTRQKRFIFTGFVELFTTDLLVRKERLHHLSMQKYLKIQIKLAVQKLVLSFSQKVFFTMYLQDYSTKVQHKAQYFFFCLKERRKRQAP
jgi:hypothetical protein